MTGETIALKGLSRAKRSTRPPRGNRSVDLVMICAGSQGPTDKMHLPLGLVYIGSQLQRSGYDVKVWHLLPEEYESTLSIIKAREPLWVGLSVLSGMTTMYAAQFSKMIKVALPDTAVVWGGHHASAVPSEILQEAYVDYVITGEGEDSAVEFSNALLGDGDVESIPNVGYKTRDDGVVVNPARPLVKDLDQYELNWELLDMGSYFRRDESGRAALSFYSSRGCPFDCTFCSTPSYTGKSFRAHSPEFVVRNLAYLKQRYGFNSVWFSDDNFMVQAKRGLDIIRRLSHEGITVGTLDTRLSQMKRDMLQEFREYGVSGVFFGWESGNDRLLHLMKKGHDVALIKDRVRLLNEFGITVWASAFYGTPTETREEFYATIDFSMWLRDNLPEASTVSTYRYMPLPHTELLHLAVQEGFVYPRNQEEWRKIDPIGPYYSMQEWIPWLTAEDEEFAAWVQELGRAGMLKYRSANAIVVNSLNNFFVRRMRSKIAKRSIRRDYEMKAFELARTTYSVMRYGERRGLRSQAVEYC